VIHKLHDDGKKGNTFPPSDEKGNTGPKAKQSASFRSMSAVTKSTSRENVGCLISWASRLDTDASLAPVTSLGVVSDGVVGAQTDPLRDGTVLLLGLGQLLLGAERLVGLCGYMVSEGGVFLCLRRWRARLASPSMIARRMACGCLMSRKLRLRSRRTTLMLFRRSMNAWFRLGMWLGWADDL